MGEMGLVPPDVAQSMGSNQEQGRNPEKLLAELQSSIGVLEPSARLALASSDPAERERMRKLLFNIAGEVQKLKSEIERNRK